MSKTPDQRKIDDMNRLLVIGLSKEDVRPLMNDEDYALFVKMCDEFDEEMARLAASRTTNINFLIDTQRDLFKHRLWHDKIRHMPRY